MLEVNGLRAGYGALNVLHGLSFSVRQGEAVSLLGGNGAGKTTTLKTIVGLLRGTAGEVRLDGKNILNQSSHSIFQQGIALVPQGRELFPDMTVVENLELGGLATSQGKAGLEQNMAEVFGIFPRLRERVTQQAGTLSGGEQQMLALGRALMCKPRILLMDEPTSGIAPIVIQELTRILRQLNEAGQTILLVEQNVRMALAVTDRCYMLRNGSIVKTMQTAEIADAEALFEEFIG